MKQDIKYTVHLFYKNQ